MAEFKKVLSPVDIAEIALLAREIWYEHYVPIIGQAQVDYMLDTFQSRDAIVDQIAQNFEYYLILDHGQSTGYIGIVPENRETTLRLSKIYVRKTLRGIGLGKEALEFVEGLCRVRNIKTIRLSVNKNNSRSIAWYERMGFRNVGAIVQDIGGGFVMDDFIMEKKLTLPQSRGER